MSHWLTDQGVRVGQETIRKWCQRGQLNHIVLPNGSYLIRRDDALKILGQSSNGATADVEN